MMFSALLKHHAKFILNLVVTKNSKCNYRSNFCTNHLNFFLGLLLKLPKFFRHFAKNSDNAQKEHSIHKNAKGA